jgi:hypothetical protein
LRGASYAVIGCIIYNAGREKETERGKMKDKERRQKEREREKEKKNRERTTERDREHEGQEKLNTGREGGKEKVREMVFET